MQRTGFTYFILASIELHFWKKIDTELYKNSWKYYISDLIYAIPHTIVVSVLLLIWLGVVYLLPVPGCPSGYMGPGGLEDGGRYYNCTGGATAYIDRLLLGENHLYATPSQVQIYKTVKNNDPEGLLGILTSVVLGYFGTIAGRVLLFYQNGIRHSLTFLAWSLVTLVLFGALTQFDMEGGFIPVVRNLWTLSFMLISASTAFLILTILCVVIEINEFWNGNPFVYVGCNSFFVYMSHILFRYRFPNQWKTDDLCTKRMFMCIWATTFWSLITAYLYHRQIFFNF